MAQGTRVPVRAPGLDMSRRHRLLFLKRDWQLYLLLLLPVAFVILFKYAAYPGLRIAFMNYKPARGYAGSE